MLIPEVLKGRMSIVGPKRDQALASTSFMGKPGLTGIVQINEHEDVTEEEAEKYNLYYAKNQSLPLDIEIMLKSMTLLLRP